MILPTQIFVSPGAPPPPGPAVCAPPCPAPLYYSPGGAAGSPAILLPVQCAGSEI